MRTSNESDRVAAEVMTAYQNDPVFLDDLRAGKIEKIISIHSRAGHEFVEIQGLTEDMKLLISRQDFHSYGISQAFFHAVSPSPIEFVGIVVPVSKKTPDLYFQADSFPANLEALKVYRNQEHILELEKQHNELFAFIHKMEREHKETVDEQHAYQEKTNKENFAHVDKIQKAYKEVIDELIVDRNKAVELSNKAVELSEKLHRVYADALEAMGKKKPDPIQN